MTTNITLTEDQLAALIAKAVCQAMGAKDSGASTAAPKSSKPSKPKTEPKAPSGGQAVWRALVDEVYQELKDAYYAANPELKYPDGSSKDQIDKHEENLRKMAKIGKAPAPPIYGDAMKEASRRRCERDEEAAKKAKAYRERTDKMIAERRAAKASDKSSDTSKTSKSSKSTKTEPPKTEVVTVEDPDEYNKILDHDGVRYAMNGKNHVATIPEGDEDPEWVGIWDPVKKTIIECEQPDD